jgi:ribulose-5-phosphate 4-epimerase/fuculose-1-phosphate aldolase
LTPDRLARIDHAGRPLNANKASKEFPFHLAAYEGAGARARAIVHLHCTYSVALSCLETLDEADPLPVFTPYYLMRVAPLAVLPYFRPGSGGLAAAVGAAAVSHDSMLLRNHGVICLGGSLEEAVDRTEELEETAKLWFLTRHERLRLLTPAERGDIENTFRKR